MRYARVDFRESPKNPERSVFYEIDSENNVPRIVIFLADGSVQRESLAEDPLAKISLVEIEFPTTEEFPDLNCEEFLYAAVTADEFEQAWVSGGPL
jgi:hypothetical protein